MLLKGKSCLMKEKTIVIDFVLKVIIVDRVKVCLTYLLSQTQPSDSAVTVAIRGPQLYLQEY